MHDHKWSVNHWGSHPDAGNDDCFTGDDFDTLEQAKASDLYLHASFDVMYIEVDGPIESKHHEVRRNPNYSARECRMQDSLESSERAMQAGMMGGIAAYNEAIGSDCDSYENEEPWGESHSAF
jgi:hypothetical protein